MSREKAPPKPPSNASKKSFCRQCRLMYDRRLVCGSGGNLALRNSACILLSPTGHSLRALQPAQVAVTDGDGHLIEGLRPTREAGMHLAVLRARPDVHAVCHTHGAAIIAAASLLPPGPESLPPITPGFALCAHPLPVIPYFTPGSDELSAAVANILGSGGRQAVLLQNHGLVTAGRDFDEAFNVAEEVEEAAHAYLLARGKARFLTSADLDRLK